MISSKKDIKIIDLGESNYFGDDIVRQTVRGTKIYFCPEIANMDEQDDKVDVWCVGVILYELIFQTLPFNGSEDQMMENIRVKNY